MWKSLPPSQEVTRLAGQDGRSLTTGAAGAVFSEFTNDRITAEDAKAMGSEANTALDQRKVPYAWIR
jgi:hypothetical protein